MDGNESPAWRVIVWAAVSSKAQSGEDKVSLSAQEEQGREFAETVGGAVVDVLTVPGHSRDIVLFEDAARAMPAYAQLQAHCQARDFDVLWARDPDRLGRDPALAQTVASLVERAGAEVFCSSAPHVLGQSASGQRYVYAIQSVRSGEEQRRRVQHLKMGMRKRIERGLMANSMPLGFCPVRDPLSGDTVGAEFDDQIGTVRLATEMFLRGASYHDIARALTASPYRPPRSGRDRWAVSTVRKILLSDVYAGHVWWGDYERTTASDRFPALWDDETYQAILRERESRKGVTYRRRQGSPFLDVAFCARCSGRMARHYNSGSAVPRLRCSTHSRHAVTGRWCHRNSIRESEVAEVLCAFLAGITDVAALEERMQAQDDATRDRERLVGIERGIQTAEAKRRRLAMAYAGSAMDVQIYRETDDQLVTQIEALRSEGVTVERRLTHMRTPAQRFETIGALRRRCENLLAAEPHEVAAMLRQSGIRIEVEHGQVIAVLIR